MAAPGPRSQQNVVPPGPPYRPQFQSFGEVPSIIPDVPINVVFLLLFTIGGASHFIVFLRNMKRKYKFPSNMMITVFCFTRIIATSLRIAWACKPTDINVGITAMVFVYAGIVLLFLVNLVLAQRILRAQHPRFGWSKPLTYVAVLIVVVTISLILCLIAALIVKFYTLKTSSLDAATIIQKFGSTWLAFVAFAPILIVSLSSATRRLPHIRKTKTTDKFGKGSMRAKVIIVLTVGVLLCFGASFRAATDFLPPAPIVLPNDPTKAAPAPWYLSKPCFYVFNFTFEICVVYLCLFIRIDKRFHIPDGASGPFSYAGGFVFAGEVGNEKPQLSIVPESQQQLNPQSRRGSRVSITSQWSKQERMSRLERRISWGGYASPDEIQSPATEDGQQNVPDDNTVESPVGDDIAVEGAGKEMGWDPKSGKWALRPASRASKTPSRQTSYPPSPVEPPTAS